MLEIAFTMQLVSRHTHMGTTLCDTRLYSKVENNMDLQCVLCNCFVVWCVSGLKAPLACVSGMKNNFILLVLCHGMVKVVWQIVPLGQSGFTLPTHATFLAFGLSTKIPFDATNQLITCIICTKYTLHHG